MNKLVPLAALAGLVYFGTRKKKKAKSSTDAPTPKADLPSADCGLYPWLPHEVDQAIEQRTDAGEREPESLALHAARTVYAVTPEGTPQPWPPHAQDARARCILDRIKIRVNLILAQLGDDEADDDEEPIPTPGPVPNTIAPNLGTCPEGYRFDPQAGCVSATRPDGFSPFEGPQGDGDIPDEEDENEWEEYPEPGPVDLTEWTDPENYPTPGKLHQIGGDNSGITLKKIARKALTTAFFLVHGDLELADQLARRSENWRTYRQIINCSPWNHLLYGAPSIPGETGFYSTSNGDTISLYPVHDNVRQRLANGETPDRRISDTNRKSPSGGRHALLWLPPLDELALADGRVVVKQEYWATGDWMMMPPPAILALGVTTSSERRVWGCDGWEFQWFGDEDDAQSIAPGRGWFRPRLVLRRAG